MTSGFFALGDDQARAVFDGFLYMLECLYLTDEQCADTLDLLTSSTP
jgi:hypothetical protein